MKNKTTEELLQSLLSQHNEIDFVIPHGRDAADAYECKWSLREPDVKNLKVFRQAYPRGRNFFVVPQPGAGKPRVQGLEVEVVSPADLMTRA